MLKPFLPVVEHGHVIITSRAQDFQDLGIFKTGELERLTVEHAIKFLLKRCDREDAEADERDVRQSRLARELDGLPLALEQAAAYIVEQRTSFRRYLESYRSEGLKRLESRYPALGDYPRSVVSTWAANFEVVEKESSAAADVLRLSAFFAPDAIPFVLLTRGVSKVGAEVRSVVGKAYRDPLVIHDLLRPLGRFSLIRSDGDEETYSIHRMVQEVPQEMAMDDTGRRLWSERAFRTVAQAFPAVEYVNWPLCSRLLPHALSVISRVGQDCMNSPDAGQILDAVARYMDQRGQYAEAEPLHLQARGRSDAESWSEEHPDYAASLNNLAELYLTTGQQSEAEPLLNEALAILRTTSGERHCDYATSLNNLAHLYHITGRRSEAETLSLEALNIRREVLGEGHFLATTRLP